MRIVTVGLLRLGPPCCPHYEPTGAASVRLDLDGVALIIGGGIQYRSKILDPANWVVGGYQADFEAGTTYSGILYDEAGGAYMARRVMLALTRDFARWMEVHPRAGCDGAAR